MCMSFSCATLLSNSGPARADASRRRRARRTRLRYIHVPIYMHTYIYRERDIDLLVYTYIYIYPRIQLEGTVFRHPPTRRRNANRLRSVFIISNRKI